MNNGKKARGMSVATDDVSSGSSRHCAGQVFRRNETNSWKRRWHSAGCSLWKINV